MLPYKVDCSGFIGQSFLQLIDTDFPQNHTFSKIFNWNKVEVYYSGMKNIKAIIKNHNMNILHQNSEIKDGMDATAEIRSIAL